jgi:hypothetical protein
MTDQAHKKVDLGDREDRDCVIHGRAYHEVIGWRLVVGDHASFGPLWACCVCAEEAAGKWVRLTMRCGGGGRSE